MSFYYLSEEMGIALSDILKKVCSNNKDFLKEDIAITWINYKIENNKVFKGFGFGFAQPYVSGPTIISKKE